MEYLAIITNEGKNKEKGLWKWKYTFLDIEKDKEDYFYSNKRVNYIPRIIGKLKLLESNRNKLYQSFSQDEFIPYKEDKKEKDLTQLEKSASQGINSLGNYFAKKTVSLEPQKFLEVLNDLHEIDKNWDKVATRFGKTSRMIRYWKRKLVSQTPIIPKKRGRKQIMIEDDFLLMLFLTYSPKHDTRTQQQKSDYIFEKTGHKYSQQVISYYTKKYSDFTRKRATKRYSEQDLAEIRQFLIENHWIYSLPNCLAIDEFSTHLGEASRYVWSRRGCPEAIPRKGRSANYTLILCVLNTKEKAVIKYKLIKNKKKKIKDEKTGKERIKKGTDTIDFYNFLKDMELPTNEKYYLLLDNSPIHDPPSRRPSKILREVGLLGMEKLAREKNITLIYLPGYTPELNPIELCFNTVRHFIEQSQSNTGEKLREVIDKIIDMINKKDLTKYFRHCQDFFYFDKNGN